MDDIGASLQTDLIVMPPYTSLLE